MSQRHCEERSDEAIHTFFAARWIASRSLSSGAHSRDPLARNEGIIYDSSYAFTAFFDASEHQCRRSSGSTMVRFAFDRRINTIG